MEEKLYIFECDYRKVGTRDILYELQNSGFISILFTKDYRKVDDDEYFIVALYIKKPFNGNTELMLKSLMDLQTKN